MSPTAKTNTKIIITMVGCVIGTLATVITATAKITTEFVQVNSKFDSVDTEFRQNNKDHLAIIESLTREIKRGALADEKLNIKVDDMSGKQIQVMTTQQAILKAVERINP